jgi:GNAT superfamily N-acetyltransferase
VVSDRMTIPVVWLQRLAVDQNYQKRGIGGQLLMQALDRVQQIAAELGVYGVVLEPLTARAERFYRNVGFLPVTGDPAKMYITIKAIRQILGVDVPQVPPVVLPDN